LHRISPPEILLSKYQSVANYEFKSSVEPPGNSYNKENFYRGKWILLELQRNGSSKL